MKSEKKIELGKKGWYINPKFLKGKRKEGQRRKKSQLAIKYEIACNYEYAAKLYEESNMWEDAGRIRKLQQEQKSPATKVDIGAIDHSIRISDSVIQRSSIGGTSQKRISICPYCGNDLNFPKPPKFCPYCREQIVR